MDIFTQEELSYLQDSFTSLRALVFHQMLEAKHRKQKDKAKSLREEYTMVRTIRDKLYSVNNRDTLAIDRHYLEE